MKQSLPQAFVAHKALLTDRVQEAIGKMMVNIALRENNGPKPWPPSIPTEAALAYRRKQLEEVAERRAKVDVLLKSGLTIHEISRLAGIRLGTVRNDLQALRRKAPAKRNRA